MLPRIALLIVLTALAGWGCRQEAADGESNGAEIPQPGPAVTDPGPAPKGQWEPPVDGDPPAAAGDAAETPAIQQIPSQDVPADKTGKGEAASKPPAAENDPSISLNLQRWEETEKLIASHKGKIVVVDFWSTSCLPCRREFPHLVALQKAHPDDVACVSVSLDYSGRKSRPPETYREPVLTFLNQQQARIDNILSTDDPDELYGRLKLPPIPLVWVFDRSGQRRQSFDNGDLEGEEFTYEADVVPFVESLLNTSQRSEIGDQKTEAGDQWQHPISDL